MNTLEGKRVLITGGARGIGLRMAEEFGAKAASVILADVATGELARAESALRHGGATVSSVRMDVADDASIDEARSRIHDGGGPIDVLVNNAGIVAGGPFLEISPEQHRRTYAVNTTGVVAVTHAFLPDLVGRTDAHLVNIASASGFIGLPFGATYASSKWAVIGFSESIRAELSHLGHDHVHVTTVCPSYIATGMFEGVKAPWLAPLLEPTEVAKAVVAAVETNEAFVITPALVRLTPVLKWLLPTWLFDSASSYLGIRQSMESWKGHSRSKGAGEEKLSA